MSKTSWRNVALVSVVALASSFASAATYINAAVTDATLAESGAVNVFDGYDFAPTADVSVGADGVGNVTLNAINGSTITGDAARRIFVGGGVGNDNVSMTITGSTVTTGYFEVGANSSSNGAVGGDGGANASVLVNGGSVITTTGGEGYQYSWVGADTSSNATLTISGSGSQFRSEHRISMGGSNGKIILEDGGSITTDWIYLNRNVASDSGNAVYLKGGSLILSANASEPNQNFVGSTGNPALYLWDGSAYVDVTTLDDAQKAALGYSVTIYTASEFAAEFGSGALLAGQATSDYTVYTQVPEPASMSVLAIGGIAALIRRRRR